MNLIGCPTVPQPPVNGYVCGMDDASSGKVQFCCERGYRLQGTRTATCNTHERKWLPVAGATCERKTRGICLCEILK